MAVAMNIKDEETERLAAEVAALASETKTRAVKVALQERHERLRARTQRRAKSERLLRFLVEEAWPQVPDELLGVSISKEERETILGYGPNGV